jgi:hypothetical protein
MSDIADAVDDVLINDAGVDIYVLDSKYYQKLGEVWDHETKDFKVLYKPLYNCGSKSGSYEAHHLATSTFERWQRKFTPVRAWNRAALSSGGARDHVVAPASVLDLSAGNDRLPLLSVPLPYSVQKGSAPVSTVVGELPAAAPPGATVMPPEALISCRSDSGFGSRSLTPYFVIDFSSEFQQMIVDGRKKATTRVLKANVENGEPELHTLVTALLKQQQRAQEQWSGLVASAVSDVDDVLPPAVFAQLRVTGVQCVLFSELTADLAALEQFPSLEAFKRCLRRFYPWIQPHDEVHVFHFELN